MVDNQLLKTVRFFIYITILFFFVTIYSLRGQNVYKFDHYNKQHGLNDNYINQVIEDSRGFIWVATRSGLRIFDGISFREISFSHFKNTNIDINYINVIAEDKNNNIWLGCPSGLYCYNFERNTIKLFEHFGNDSNSISSYSIVDIEISDNNDIWIATMDGLNLYNPKEDNFKRFAIKTQFADTVLPYQIFDISIASNNKLLIATRYNGLNSIDINTKKLQLVHKVTDIIHKNNVNAVLEDNEKNIWILSANNGVYILKNEDNSIVKLSLKNFEHNEKFNKAIYSSIIQDNKGNIWITTYGDGIFIINPKTYELIDYTESDISKYRIQLKSTGKITADKNNNLWIASHGGGISVYSPLKNESNFSFYNYKNSNLPGNIISCFCEDNSGNIWIGIDGNGFCLFDKTNKTFKNFTKKDGLSSNSIMDIVQIDDNTLAISTWNGGLNLFDINKKTFQTKKELGNNILLNNVHKIRLDTINNYLWCGTYNNGVQIFDISKKRFLIQKELEKVFPHYNKREYISKILIDSDRNIWTIEANPITIYDSNNVEWNIETLVSNKCNLPKHGSDIIEDSQKNIWIATRDGVIKYNKQENYFKSIVDQKNVVSIIEDDNRNIWYATSNELFRYNTLANETENISIKWGVPEIQFFPRSTFMSSDGYLMFGGVEGYLMIHQDSSYKNNIDPPIYITGFSIHNEKQYVNNNTATIKKEISYVEEIKLKHDQTFITFNFAALNFIDNKKTRYKYKLEGFDIDWQTAHFDPIANYTNVPPGTYTFRVKTNNSDGIWSQNERNIIIKILPPWWNTWWFKLALSLFLVAIIFLVILYREKSIKEHNLRLEAIVAERTEELEATNNMLQKGNDSLKNQKEEIQQHLNELREKQMVIQMKNTELHETLEIKDKLITIIAHDFRNPLTAILGFADILLNKAKINDDKRIEYTKLMSNSVKKILAQMDDVLNWSSIKNKSIKCEPSEVNLETIILDVLSLLNESAFQHKINFRTKFQFEHLAYVDARMISIVLRNIVTNSIKYSKQESEIVIALEENSHNMLIRVSDDGYGISEDKLNQILTGTDNSNISKGFGLEIVKSFIAKNKGQFFIKSEIDKGTTVSILLPKSEKKIQSIPLLEKSVDELLYVNIEDIEFDKTPKMLIIDDNEEITSYLRDVFSTSFKIHFAYNGQKGYAIAQEVVPDIILSDVDMPLLNGIELCKMLKANIVTSHIPIILISAQTNEKYQIKGLEAGANDYIIKPFNISILQQKIQKVLIANNKEAKNNENIINSVLPESVDDKLLKKVTNIIMEHISDCDFSVEVLAQEANMSRSQLYRKFKATINIAPMDYIRNMRLERAMEMIKTGKYRISEIADGVGFSDSAYFSRCFTSTFGAPPTSFGPKRND